MERMISFTHEEGESYHLLKPANLNPFYLFNDKLAGCTSDNMRRS